MAKRVQLIRHSTGSADAFTGLNGEITVDTTAKELRVHDSLTAGGIATARKDMDNVAAATVSIGGKMSAAQVVELTSATVAIAQEIIDRIADVDAEEAARILADALLIPLTQKAAALGVATLNAASKVVQTALLADAAATLTGLTSSIAELNKLSGTAIFIRVHELTYGAVSASFSLPAPGGGLIHTVTIPNVAVGDIIRFNFRLAYDAVVGGNHVQLHLTPGSGETFDNYSGSLYSWQAVILSAAGKAGIHTVSGVAKVTGTFGGGVHLVFYAQASSVGTATSAVSYEVERAL